MASLLGRFVRNLVFLTVVAVVAAGVPLPSIAAPYAAYVMDARTGETLYEKNADARLHPASLTKMLTLYIAFQAIERGEINLNTMVTVSKNAAAEPPSRLGLRAGQKIALRHLIRAAAIKSANDAATAIGEAIEGSEEAFANRMNRTAKALGMRNSTFRNANGLTREGHLSTARDMTILGRRLFFDFPQYYNIFSRRSTDAGLAEVNNTNRRFLDSYEGADGIKTGYTQAAGFNLTASAQRGNKRIIATVFGGTSTPQRNAKMKELLDLGFGKAPGNAPVVAPEAPVYADADDSTSVVVAENTGPASGTAAGKTIRLQTAVSTSPRPRGRPSSASAGVAVAEADIPIVSDDAIAAALAEATSTDLAVAEALGMVPASAEPIDAGSVVTLASAAVASPAPAPKPEKRKATVIHTASSDGNGAAPAPTEVALAEPEVVTRISTSGGQHWGVNLGRFNSHAEAERVLLTTALAETATLSDGLKKIVQKGGGYDANFLGLSQEQADLACRRLQARGTQCFTIGP